MAEVSLELKKFWMLHLKLARDIKKEYFTSLSLILLIAIGVGAYSATIAGWISLSENIEAVYDRYNFEDVHVQLFQPIDQKTLVSVISSADESITSQVYVNERLVLDVSLLLSNSNGEVINKISLRIIGLNITERELSFKNPNNYMAINDVFIFDGAMLSLDDVNGTNIVLDSRLAREHDIFVDDEISVLFPSNLSKEVIFRVKGLGSNPEYIVPLSSLNDPPASSRRFGVAFASLKTLQRVSGLDGKVNDVVMVLKKEASIDRKKVASYFGNLLEENGILIYPPYTREYQQSNHILYLDLRAVSKLGTKYPLFLLFIGSFGMYLVLSRIIRGQKKFIGLALASGYSRRHVFLHYVEYSLFLGSLGTILGIFGGWILSQAVIRLYSERLSIPTLKTIFPMELLLTSIPIGLISVTLGAFFPSWRATKLTPRECLTNPPFLNVKMKKKSYLEVSLLKLFPNMKIETLLALRNLRRNIGRTLVIILTVGLAMSLFLSSRSFLDSGYHTVEIFYGNETVEWDARIQFYQDKPVSERFIDKLLTIEGIIGVTLTLELPTVVSGFENTFKRASSTFPDIFDVFSLPEPRADFIQENEFRMKNIEGLYLVVLSGNTSAFTFELLEGQFSENAILISDQFAQVHGISIGDNITIALPKILWGTIFGITVPRDVVQQNVTLVVSGFTREFTSFLGYMSIETYKRLTDWRFLPLYNRGYIKIADGADKNEVRKSVLQTFENVRSFEYQEEIEDNFQEVLRLMNVVVTVFSFFSTTLGMVLLVAILLVSVLERERELATMQVVGASRKLIIKTLLTEYLAVGFLGIMLGLGLGYVTGLYFFSLVGTELYQGLYHISITTYYLSIISALFMIISAVLLVAQVVFRRPLAESTKTFI